MGIIAPHFAKLKKISHQKGDVYQCFRANDGGEINFGEIYFTRVNQHETKGWKKHLIMCMCLVVPVGAVRFNLINEITNEKFVFELNDDDLYGYLYVPSNIWVSFTGISNLNVVMNCASIPHDPSESISLDLNAFQM